MRARRSALRGGILALAAALLGSAATGCGPAKPRGVVLVSVDTLRADHLGCYGAERPTSPNLDRLAREGVLFEQAWATAPWTLPSHASLLTGRFPEHHGVRTREDALPVDVPTLATTLGLRGVATAAAVNVIWLGPYFGLQRGFSSFRALDEDQGPDGAARRVTEAGLGWLDARGDAPFLLFLHYFDVHSDYRSRDDVERLFVERRDDDEGSTRRIMQLVAGAPRAPDEVERLEALYDAGILQLDRELGRLFEGLRERDLFDETWILVTADHGEEFLDHGSLSHGHGLHEELLRVPLVLRGPGIPHGRRIPTPVSLVDVVPTILTALGEAPLEALDGVDLATFWRGGDAPARALFAGAVRGARPDEGHAVRLGGDKLIVSDDGSAALYDLDEDPGERDDLAARRPGRVVELRRLLDGHRAGRRSAERAPDLGEEEQQQLRALGYVE